MVVADTLSRSPLKLEQEPDTVVDVQAFLDLVESASWIMRSTGPQKLKSSVKTKVLDHTSYTMVVEC